MLKHTHTQDNSSQFICTHLMTNQLQYANVNTLGPVGAHVGTMVTQRSCEPLHLLYLLDRTQIVSKINLAELNEINKNTTL